MWEQDWALLGIEPTTELAAIKKAYALKLRVTRPDDDAEAYQALRSAYERVQQWLKWQRENAVEEDVVEAPAAAAPDDPPPEPTVPPDEPLLPPEPVVEPRHLIDELALQWRHSGEPALMSGWQDARRALDAQPLSRQAEFSAAFAQWALAGPNLPDAFLKALDAHFGWLSDFRAERQLGTALAQALHEALDARLHPRPVDPAVRALAAPLQGLDTLRKAGAPWWRLQLMFFLLQPTITRNQGMLGTQWLLLLGLDLEAQRWLKRAVVRGQWLRVGLATALFMAAAQAVFKDAIVATAHGLTWLFGTGAIMVVGILTGALVSAGVTLTTPKRRLGLPLERWRRHPSQPWLGLVWLLFAAWLNYVDNSSNAGSASGGLLALLPPWAYGYATWGFAIAGLLMAWPLNMAHGSVVAGLLPLVGYLAVAALGTWLSQPACVFIGAAWMLVAAAIHEDRLERPVAAPVRWLLRPMLNSFTLADRWAYSVPLLPLAVCAAWAVLNDGQVQPLRIFVIWVLCIQVVAWLQSKAEAWGLRQMPEVDAGAA